MAHALLSISLIGLLGSPAPPLSRSLGFSYAGRLQNGVPLPTRGKHHGVFRHFHSRESNYGTAELIAILLHGARRVADQYPGSRLMMGNLSRRFGGKIWPSVTHQSGRDADIALFHRGHGRRPNPSGWYQNFDRQLRSVYDPTYRFDVARNWALVRAFLTHPTVDVQWIFVARWLKRALLQHAKTVGAPRWLIRRAWRVVQQPSKSSPHAGHFHLRIYCSAADRRAGCVDRGRVWWWVSIARRKRRRLRRKQRSRRAERRRATPRASGTSRRRLRRSHVARLVALTARPGELGLFADRELARRTYFWSPGVWASTQARHEHWLHYCQRHPARCKR